MVPFLKPERIVLNSCLIMLITVRRAFDDQLKETFQYFFIKTYVRTTA